VDQTTPTPVAFSGLPSTGVNVMTGMLAFVTDAIASRSNIVSIRGQIDDEDPGSTKWCAATWHGHPVSWAGPLLAVTYQGDLIQPRRHQAQMI
jgi:hypothetical protein